MVLTNSHRLTHACTHRRTRAQKCLHNYNDVIITRDGTQYSNIQKSAEYSNSKIIFDYSIFFFFFFFWGGGGFQMSEKKKKNCLKNIPVKSPISQRSIIEVTCRLFVCNFSKTRISIYLTPCKVIQSNLIFTH